MTIPGTTESGASKTQNQPKHNSEPSPPQDDLCNSDLGSVSESSDRDEIEDEKFLTIEYDVDAWDDTALIEAYERAVKSYGSKRGAKSNLPHKGQETTTPDDPQRSREEGPTRSVFIPGVEPSRKRKASNDSLPQPALPHVRVSKRMKRSIHREEGPFPLTEPIEARIDVVASDEDRKMMIPPPPPPVLCGEPLSEELEKLLKSWYEAGYRAGFYVGKQSR